MPEPHEDAAPILTPVSEPLSRARVRADAMAASPTMAVIAVPYMTGAASPNMAVIAAPNMAVIAARRWQSWLPLI